MTPVQRLGPFFAVVGLYLLLSLPPASLAAHLFNSNDTSLTSAPPAPPQQNATTTTPNGTTHVPATAPPTGPLVNTSESTELVSTASTLTTTLHPTADESTTPVNETEGTTAPPITTPPTTHAIQTSAGTIPTTLKLDPNESVTSGAPDVTGSLPVQPTSFYTTLVSTHNLGERFELNSSEMAITIFFSTILGVAVLVFIMYSLNKCKRKSAQYSHRPLYNTADETVDRYSAPDDTLVISGGLYDGIRIYNPNMTVLEEDEEELHPEHRPFGSRAPQFRLEFLPEEQGRPPSTGGSTFETFQAPPEEL
ncbi:uncharacterized protein LOC117962410 [Acipenser ruthenus]|uniref:uncharacterized protein LOC117962410 n=1 Tax=Acipenser ruthenus TaxID=7906 RepID=UPI0027413692|nr:uncharacterized protein LOC117962410 [Acipenser ruthenus]XP_058861012.1 uncharacterized protein LOC117962410 [Acipenser ruthenus]